MPRVSFVKVFQNKRILDEMLDLAYCGVKYEILATQYKVNRASITYQCQKHNILRRGELYSKTYLNKRNKPSVKRSTTKVGVVVVKNYRDYLDEVRYKKMSKVEKFLQQYK